MREILSFPGPKEKDFVGIKNTTLFSMQMEYVDILIWALQSRLVGTLAMIYTG